MTVEVPLTRGYVALVDDEDAERVLSLKWCALPRPHTVYAMRGARRPDGGQTTTRLHNFVTGWQFVDHVNGNGLDNRRANLRQANPQGNQRNRRKLAPTTSRFKGVHWSTHRNVWVAQIKVDRRGRHLGQFADEIAAARAYDAAALEHFGPFARLNFPDKETAA